MLDALKRQIRHEIEKQAAVKQQVAFNIMAILSAACSLQRGVCDISCKTKSISSLPSIARTSTSSATSTSGSASSLPPHSTNEPEFCQAIADVLLLMRNRLAPTTQPKPSADEEDDLNDAKRRIILRAMIYEADLELVLSGASVSAAFSGASFSSSSATSSSASSSSSSSSSASSATRAALGDARSPPSSVSSFSSTSSSVSSASSSYSSYSTSSSSLSLPSPISPECVTVLDWRTIDTECAVHPWEANISAFEVLITTDHRHSRRYFADVFPVLGREQLAYFARVSDLYSVYSSPAIGVPIVSAIAITMCASPSVLALARDIGIDVRIMTFVDNHTLVPVKPTGIASPRLSAVSTPLTPSATLSTSPYRIYQEEKPLPSVSSSLPTSPRQATVAIVATR